MRLTPAELAAIEEHKYFLSIERGAEVSIDEAIEDFVRRFADEWRREKQRRDILEQRSEILEYYRRRSVEEGRDIGRSTAAEEWCDRWASLWRAERESLERNGFHRTTAVVRNPESLDLRPSSKVATTAAMFDCDVYVHRDGMPYWNFVLDGRPFMNVKSVVGLLSLGVALGETLEFIATGAQAEPALEALREMVEAPGESGTA